MYLEYLKCMAHGCMKSTGVHYTWKCGTGLPGAGSETGLYLEYLKLCWKLYRKLSIHLTHIPDLLIRPVEKRRCLEATQATQGLIHIRSKMES